MNVELIQNLLINSGFKGVTMHRANFLGRRCYIKPEPFKVYSGLTGALEASTFKGDILARRLISWREMQVQTFGTVDKADANLSSMGDFGTYLHEALVEIWQTQSYDFEAEKAREFFMESDKKLGIPHNEAVVTQKVFEVHKGIAALMQFVYDEISDILAIETMCYSDEYSIATPVDLVGVMKDGKKVALNMKTSKQISDHQLNQTAIEAWMWNQTYENNKVEYTGVWRAKDWTITKKPTYEVKLMNGDEVNTKLKVILPKLRACLADPESTYASFDREVRIFTGKIKLGEAPKIVTKTIEQAFEERMAEQDKEQESIRFSIQ